MWLQDAHESQHGTTLAAPFLQLQVLGLASLVFFSVAGSPAGSEDSVAAGGALFAIIGFLVLPLVWSIPEALITAELATTFPHNGGFVMCVQ